MRGQEIETMWAAFRALSSGNEPPERVIDFLAIIEPRLAAFIERERHRLSADDQIMLMGLRRLLLDLLNAASNRGPGRMKLTLSPQGRGNPGKSFKEQRERESLLDEAARIVERVLEDDPDANVQDALTDAEEATGVSRAEINKHRRRLRDLRDPKRILERLDELALQIPQ